LKVNLQICRQVLNREFQRQQHQDGRNQVCQKLVNPVNAGFGDFDPQALKRFAARYIMHKRIPIHKRIPGRRTQDGKEKKMVFFTVYC
jgi:hypothetical protein